MKNLLIVGLCVGFFAFVFTNNSPAISSLVTDEVIVCVDDSTHACCAEMKDCCKKGKSSKSCDLSKCKKKCNPGKCDEACLKACENACKKACKKSSVTSCPKVKKSK